MDSEAGEDLEEWMDVDGKSFIILEKVVMKMSLITVEEEWWDLEVSMDRWMAEVREDTTS